MSDLVGGGVYETNAYPFGETMVTSSTSPYGENNGIKSISIISKQREVIVRFVSLSRFPTHTTLAPGASFETLTIPACTSCGNLKYQPTSNPSYEAMVVNTI